jgi:hypothetical protein
MPPLAPAPHFDFGRGSAAAPIFTDLPDISRYPRYSRTENRMGAKESERALKILNGWEFLNGWESEFIFTDLKQLFTSSTLKSVALPTRGMPVF